MLARNLIAIVIALVVSLGGTVGMLAIAPAAAAPLAALPQTVLNTASAIYGNGVTNAEQINSTSNALHVLVTGSSAASDSNITKWGGTTVTAGAALADDAANPTTGQIGSFAHAYDGTTWDRLRTASNSGATLAGVGILASGNMLIRANNDWRSWATASNSTTSDGNAGDQSASIGVIAFNSAGTWDRVRSGAFTAATSATGVLNSLGLSIYNTTLPTYTNGQFGTLQMGSRGSLNTQLIDVDGTQGLDISASAGDAEGNLGSLYAVARLQALNGSSTWDRLRTVGSGDFSGTGLLATGMYVFDGTSTYNRVRSGDQNNVAAATGFLNTLPTARYNATLPTLTDTRYNALQVGSRGGLHTNIMDVNGTTGAKVTSAGGLNVEQGPFSSSGRLTADTQVKASAGFLHTITLSPLTATPTAGAITIYDNTTETGGIVFSEWFFATDQAHTVTLNVPTTNGIYVGYDGTAANIGVTVSYR